MAESRRWRLIRSPLRRTVPLLPRVPTIIMMKDTQPIHQKCPNRPHLMTIFELHLSMGFIHPPAPWVGSQPCGAKYPGFCADSKGV